MWVIKEYAKAIIALLLLGIILWFQSTFEIISLPATAKQMEPTVASNSFYVLSQTTRSISDFKHEDIAFFSFATQKGKEIFVSRIVGLPGDRLRINDGKLIRNENPIDEIYLPRQFKGFYYEEITVPRGYLFVLNDDRERINDSRLLGPIPWTRVMGIKRN